jgi:hypothetical protein
MLKHSRFEPIVALVTDQASVPDPIFSKDLNSINYADLSQVSKFLEKRNIRHIVWDDEVENISGDGFDLLAEIEPSVIFRQSHWEDCMPLEFKMESLVNYRVCYLPYEFEIVEVPHTTVEQPLFQNAWKIFVASQRHCDYYRQKNPKLNVEVLHSPKLEEIAKRSRMRTSADKKTVLWAPHHSVGEDWLRFGTFHQNYVKILALAENNPNLNFVFRGHHLLFSMLIQHRQFSNEDVQNFLSKWGSLQNTSLDTNPDYAESFANSDVLLTDGISFLIEYLVTGKPLIYIERPGHEQFTSVGEHFVEMAIKCSQIEEVEPVLRGIIAREIGRVDVTAQIAAKELLSPKLDAATQILQSILNGTD